MKTILLISFFVFISCLSLQSKRTIGETAYIQIEGIDMDYLARIDTGASTTSIHAVNIKVKDSAKKKKDDIGKKITFDTINHNNVKKEYTAQIVDTSKILNSQGSEYRYEIELTLNWKGTPKKVVVNLRDRSKMTYKLLIGRNWLQDSYVVDVNMKAKK